MVSLRTNGQEGRRYDDRSARRITDRATTRTLAILVALGSLLSHLSAFAATPPPGIYALGRDLRLDEDVSGDGSRLNLSLGVGIWEFETGIQPEFHRLPPYSFRRLHALSSDHRFALGERQTPFESVLVDGQTGAEWSFERPFELLSPFSEISPNGQYVAGGTSLRLPSPLSPDPDNNVAIWDAENGARIVERPPEFGAVTTVGITNDGTAYGTGWIRPTPTASFFLREAGLRWNAAGVAERLAGVDANGRAWAQWSTLAISLDGERRLGTGTLEMEAEDGSLEERVITAVFDDAGASWILQFNDVFPPSLGDPFRMGLSGDGSLVFVNGIAEEPLVVTEESGVQTLTALMQASGLDIEGWNFEQIVDVSDDGTVILALDVQRDGRFRESQGILIVLPEPGTALLVGLGLVALASGRPRRA